MSEVTYINHVKLFMRSGAVVEFDCLKFEAEQKNSEIFRFGWTSVDGQYLSSVNPSQIDAITFTQSERS